MLEVSFNHRRRADVQYVKGYLADPGSGAFTTRGLVEAAGRHPGLTSWFTSKTMAGGGALIDLGPHILESVLFLLGEPRVVAVSAVTHGELGRAGYGAMDRAAQMASDSGVFEVEDLASALLRLDDGSSIALEISWAGHTSRRRRHLDRVARRRRRSAHLGASFKSEDTVRIYRDDAGRRHPRPRGRQPCREHRAVIAEFVATVLGGDWGGHPRRVRLHRTEILDACYRSAAEGREVRL